MRVAPIICGLLLIATVGCRTPQQAMKVLKCSEPCFDRNIVPQTVEPVEQFAEAASIEEYVQLGLARSPAIAEARHKIDAIRHRIPQALSLPDPTVNTTTYLTPLCAS